MAYANSGDMAKYKGKTDKSTIPGRVRDLGYESYAAYLCSGHWKDVRRRYSESDRPQDCKCGRPGTQLHHLTYERLGAEEMTDLEAMCKGCHRALERPKRRKKKRPRAGYMQGKARRRREHARRTKKTSNATVHKEKGLGL